jgi:LytS/YehU family sensor histidine kinase
MRSTLNIVNNESINLFSEIEYLKNYIELENYRRNNDVIVDYFIDEFSSLKNITIPSNVNSTYY